MLPFYCISSTIYIKCQLVGSVHRQTSLICLHTTATWLTIDGCTIQEHVSKMHNNCRGYRHFIGFEIPKRAIEMMYDCGNLFHRWPPSWSPTLEVSSIIHITPSAINCALLSTHEVHPGFSKVWTWPTCTMLPLCGRKAVGKSSKIAFMRPEYTGSEQISTRQLTALSQFHFQRLNVSDDCLLYNQFCFIRAPRTLLAWWK